MDGSNFDPNSDKEFICLSHLTEVLIYIFFHNPYAFYPSANFFLFYLLDTANT